MVYLLGSCSLAFVHFCDCPGWYMSYTPHIQVRAGRLMSVQHHECVVFSFQVMPFGAVSHFLRIFIQVFLFFFWQLFLCVLPQDKSQWISKIKELRAWYSSVKEIVSCALSNITVFLIRLWRPAASDLCVCVFFLSSTSQTLGRLLASKTWWSITPFPRTKG